MLLAVLIPVFMTGNDAIAQGRGTIKGVIYDAQSGEPLMFANVGIEGTSFGTTADEEGEFSITLPAGNYKLAFSYLSYNTVHKELELKRNEILNLGKIELKVQSIMGEEVVITGIARGQLAAINRQVNSNTIVNVVSKERIQELPDQNAAETVGRLPGVSLVRDGGEGTMVTLRGMAPRLNLITINGERVPSTNDQDRSVDLSMFSTEALAGIEVYKALRPDMDADALGGTVNFTARKASAGFHGDVKVQSGYNSLKQEPGQYQGSATFETRFFENKLGLIASGTVQKANRSYEGYTGSWEDLGSTDNEGDKSFAVSSITLRDQHENRFRYNGSMNLDYQFDKGELMFSTNYGQTDRDETRWRRIFDASGSYQKYDIRKRESTNNVLTSNFSGKFTLFNLIDLDFSAGYSRSQNERPLVETFQFRELGAFNPNDETSYDIVIEAAQNELDKTWLKYGYLDHYDVDDINKTAQVNLKMPFRLGNDIEGYVKMGGKYRTMDRDYDVTREWTRSFVGKYIIEDTLQHPDWAINADNGWILMENFLTDYEGTDDFMRHFDNPYYMGPGAGVNGQRLNYNQLREFREEYYEDYYYVDPTIDIADYHAGENIAAAYAMYELHFFDRITLIGGVRYEYTKNDYESVYGTPQVDEEGEIINISGLRDTIGSREHQQFLPQFHFKYKALPWADVRLAVTKSLSRPNFFSLVPWERVKHFDHEVERGNPDLVHMSAWNYDAIVSLYGKFGLFTIGAFYKSLENIDYTLTTRIVDDELPTNGYDLTMPVNAERTSTIMGMEFDLQTNFRFLPSPFDGFVINANYTMIESETFFPYIIITNLPVFPYTATVTDTMRSGPMPGQVDDVVNLSIGYEKRGFSARISMVYQSSSLQVSEGASIGSLAKSVGTNAALDSYTGSSTRWDMTVRQRFKKNFTLFANLNNITNTPEITYLAGSKNNLLTRNIVYGFTWDIGLRYKF